MKQNGYKVVINERVAPGIFRMRLSSVNEPCGFVRGGQFADFAIPGYFLRRPLAATEWDENGFSVLYKVVGNGTDAMSELEPGATLDVLTGLGNGFDAAACREKALVVCGGLGASPAFSLVKELKAGGKQVTLILGFNTAADVVLEREYKALGVEPVIVTMDGGAGLRGLVTDAIKAIQPEYDYFYTCGPKVMMKAVCDLLEGPGEASLEERMGCGCGICYGCTCQTGKGPRRVCADGPVFKKEEIIW